MADIDRYYLAYLARGWAYVTDIDREWDRMEEPERLDFVLEWPIKEERLARLEGWAADGALTPEQLERYHELQALVAQHRPVLERLLAEPEAPVNGNSTE